MRLSTVLIFSLIGFLLPGPPVLKGKPVSLRTGIYIFTEETASEFYLLAPAWTVGYDVWHKSRLSLQVSTGFAYNSMKYDDHRHHLYMVPLLVTMTYDLPNPDARIWPCAGMGAGLLGKADQNISYPAVHYSLSYGFHILGGLKIRLKGGWVLQTELLYNFLIPPVADDIGMSGIWLMTGVKIPVKKRGDSP